MPLSSNIYRGRDIQYVFRDKDENWIKISQSDVPPYSWWVFRSADRDTDWELLGSESDEGVRARIYANPPPLDQDDRLDLLLWIKRMEQENFSTLFTIPPGEINGRN